MAPPHAAIRTTMIQNRSSPSRSRPPPPLPPPPPVLDETGDPHEPDAPPPPDRPPPPAKLGVPLPPPDTDGIGRSMLLSAPSTKSLPSASSWTRDQRQRTHARSRNRNVR